MSAVSRHVSRLAAATGVVAAGAALITGCGQVKAPATPLSASQAIQLAAHSSSEVRSMTATETVTVKAPHFPGGTFRVTMDLAMQFRPWLLGEVSTRQAGIFTTVIITPRAVYLRWPGPAKQHLRKPWVRLSLTRLRHPASLAKLFATPRGPMVSNPLGDARLFNAATHVRIVGRGRVDGVPTTQYAGTVALAALKSLAASTGPDTFASMLGLPSISAIPFTVWVDGQHHIRKVVMTVHVHDRGRAMSLTVTLNVTSVNQPVRITLPPASQVAAGSGL